MSSRIRKRLLLLLFVGLWLALAVVAFSTIGWVQHSHRRAVDMTPTATVTLTVTPTSPPTALALITITVRPSTTGMLVGELLTVSVHIDYAPRECTFAMYDLTLRQPISDVWFTFLSPERLGPPAPTDATFALQAVKPGAVSLTAELYGEEYCGFWQWSYRYGHSPTILITPIMTSTMIYYVPWINR